MANMIEPAEDDEPRRRATALDWIKGLGLPIASLFVSGAVFFVQSQQQAFERQLSNIEDGYHFYFQYRTKLERHADADQEETLLRLISGTFPNVFCNVRADLHSRVAAAETSTEPGAFGEDDRQILLARISARDAPERMPLSSNATLPFFDKNSGSPPKCPALDGPNDQLAQVAPNDAAGAVVVPVPAPSAPPSALPEKQAAETSAPAGEAKDASPAPVASSPATSAAAQIGARLRNAAGISDARMYRVFFQISNTGERDISAIDPLRAPLAMSSFRVMRGVERVANMPSSPQVRYFGPDEEGRAIELAAALNEQFRSEGLNFKTVAVGDQYPNMPRTNLEVWLPDPADGVAPPKRPIEQAAAKFAPDALKKLAPVERLKLAPKVAPKAAPPTP